MCARRARDFSRALLDRAQAFLRRTVEAAADEVRQIEAGRVVRTASLPDSRHLNHVYLSQPVSFESAVELVAEHLRGLAVRQLEVPQAAGRRELADRFDAAGWEVEQEVLMLLERPPEPPADADAVVECGEEKMLELVRRWILEDEQSPRGTVDQHVESARRRARAARERHFGIAGEDGRLLAMTNLRSDGSVAQVENVYTAPEARGRGYARTLVAHVTRLAFDAGHDLILITADDDDWPKELYRRLGFGPRAWTWLFHRRI